jgi:hypothetical protein
MDLAAIEAERARLHAEYVKADRPESSARGIHHTALLSSDVERTIRFYQGILEFPLTEIIENRDYEGSNHFFFDVGKATCSPSSTSPASTSAPTPKSSAACTTSRSR